MPCWLASYTLDNLSLMALTIAVGFVVDDAIVMLENITRHVEEGMSPFKAALQGAGEIAFTIFSISLSLIAVFIPILLMGGIIGRLFREFSVVLSMTIVVSAFVAMALTPMLASRFLKPHGEERHGKLFQYSERFFDGMLSGYRAILDRAIQFKFVTLCIFLATTALTVVMFTVIPKGFFPAGYRPHHGSVGSRAGYFFCRHGQHQSSSAPSCKPILMSRVSP